MFARKTVFVIGAGCSMEFGLPNGWQLRDHIIRLVSADLQDTSGKTSQAFVQSQEGRSILDVRRCAELIRVGLPTKPSIDQFLDTHQRDRALVEYGKIVLAEAILNLESEASIMGRSSGTWMEPLIHAMNDKLPRDEPERMFDDVSFITFNYDRLIEHFLISSVESLIGNISAEESADLWQSIHVEHVYGKVGSLQPGSQNRVKIGSDLHPRALADVARGLRTFSEVQANPSRHKIYSDLTSAEQIVIMGSSYIDENLKVLRLGASSPVDVFALTFGLSPPKQQRIGECLTALVSIRNEPGRGSLRLLNQTAFDFMKDYADEFRR